MSDRPDNSQDTAPQSLKNAMENDMGHGGHFRVDLFSPETKITRYPNGNFQTIDSHNPTRMEQVHVEYSSNGNLRSADVTMDPGGQIIVNGHEFEGAFTTHYQFAANGNLLSESDPASSSENSYYPNGNLKTTDFKSVDGSFAHTNYQYDASGNARSAEEVSDKGTRHFTFTNDSRGHLISETVRDSQGRVTTGRFDQNRAADQGISFLPDVEIQY